MLMLKRVSVLAILLLAAFTPTAMGAEQQAADFYAQVAAGMIPGYATHYVFGHNDAVGATRETLWGQGGFATFPASAVEMQLSSGDADDAAGDTGARIVTVYGLDASYLEVTENVTLNGQTPVNTTNTYIRVLDLTVASAGSTGWNEGIIYAGVGAVVAGVPATVYNRIDATYGRDLTCFYTVPAGKTGLITSYYYSSGEIKEAAFSIFTRPRGGSAWMAQDHVHLVQNEHWAALDPPYTLEAGADVMIVASAPVATACSGGFVLVFVDDSVASPGTSASGGSDSTTFLLIVVLVFAALGLVALWRRR